MKFLRSTFKALYDLALTSLISHYSCILNSSHSLKDANTYSIWNIHPPQCYSSKSFSSFNIQLKYLSSMKSSYCFFWVKQWLLLLKLHTTCLYSFDIHSTTYDSYFFTSYFTPQTSFFLRETLRGSSGLWAPLAHWTSLHGFKSQLCHFKVTLIKLIYLSELQFLHL